MKLDSIDERRCMGLNEVFKGAGADMPECLETRLLHESQDQRPGALRFLLWQEEDGINGPEVLVALLTLAAKKSSHGTTTAPIA